MEIESSAKTVRGLNIAILVLSILSLVALLIVAASGTAISAYLASYIDDNGSIVASAIDEMDPESKQALSDTMNIIDNLSAEDVNSLGAAIGTIDANALDALKQSLSEGKIDQVETLIATGAAAANVSIDADALHQSLSQMSKSDLNELANSLNDISASDLHKIASTLQGIDENSLSTIKGAINGAGDGSLEQAGIAAVWGLMLMAIVFEVICCIVAIVAAALAMRNRRDPNKLTAAFVLAIISAVLAFFCGRIITMVLFIISAVYISKIRTFRGGQQPPMAGATPVANNSSPVMPQ